MFTKLKKLYFKAKSALSDRQLHKDLSERALYFRKYNMCKTLYYLTKLVIQEGLKEHNFILPPDLLQSKVQYLFWEWKNEGLIDCLDRFSPETEKWITEI